MSSESDSSSVLTYYSRRFFQDLKSNEFAVDAFDYTMGKVEQIIDDKVLFELEASITCELAELQIFKLASASYLPCDEDIVDDDSSFWNIEKEAPTLPIDLWASGIARTVKIPKPERDVPNSKSCAPSVASHRSYRSNTTGVTRQTSDNKKTDLNSSRSNNSKNSSGTNQSKTKLINKIDSDIRKDKLINDTKSLTAVIE